jgi:tungstate transport system substrate-binding protein
MRRRRPLSLIVLISTLWLLSCSEPPLRLGVTTTLEDSGLLDRLTMDFYHQHGIAITPIVAGSGQLFTLITRGDVDIAITHEPEGEKRLVEQGFVSSRQALFYNDFVIVGRKEDPANIRRATSTRDAFMRLIRSDSVYISRNDNSGTHRMEQYWWSPLLTSELTSPLTSSSAPQPSRIKLLFTGTGMGETLTVAANKNAYTLVDIGTWLAFNNKQHLRILWRDSKTLRNEYHLLTLNSHHITRSERIQKESQVFTQWVHEWAGKSLQKITPAEHSQPNKMPFFVDDALTNNQQGQQQEKQP